MTQTAAPAAQPQSQPAGQSRCAGRIALVVTTLVLLGFFARVGAIIHLQAWEQPGAMEHRSLAISLLLGHGFSFADFGGELRPSSVQSPPYPFLLAGLFWIFGIEAPAAYAAAMLINAIAGAITVALTYWLARTLGASALAALLAAAMMAFWPTQIYAVTMAQAITLITAFTVAIVALFYVSVRSGRLAPWIAFSIIGTLAALTEPVLLPPMAFTGILILLWRGLPLKVRFRNAAVLLAAALVIIGPWTLRNYRVHGVLMPVKSTFWVNVWKGNNPHATGTDRLAMTDVQYRQLLEARGTFTDSLARDSQLDERRQYDQLTTAQRQMLAGRTEVQREALFQQWATQWIRENPGRYAQLSLIRLGKTIWIDWDNPKSHKTIYVFSRALLLGLTALGLVIAIRQRWALGFPALVVGACLLLYALTITAARFNMPLEPLQFCLGGAVVAALVQRWRPAAAGQRDDP